MGRMMLLRHLAAILVLPFVMVVLVPRWLLATRAPGDWWWPPESPLATAGRAIGVLLLIAGLALFAWCVMLFGRVGRGTLAPWDPTKRLVAVGPYRHVRNPMITGVATMLAGEALVTGSRVLAVWLGVFALFNHAYFLLVEEPGLARRFGAAYLEYRSAVPRWIPRLTAWTGGSATRGTPLT
jgi:protein-S-isoprenylcysteine O-methyltransferase Ste14